MKKTTLLIIPILILGCSEKKIVNKSDFIIAQGQMPCVAKDKKNNLSVVYGAGDSIMYTCSSDNANTFSKPELIAVLPGVYSFATRGPQIAATDNGVIVTACTSSGNIYSFFKENSGRWQPGKKVNDVDTAAKEGLMALNADGNNVIAVWLDLRGNKRNKIYSATSGDGGKTWAKNRMVYASPDSSVCECCKPSVIIEGTSVYVMFRNRFKGNRDLYLILSTDGGKSFAQAQKLGMGSWPINGCPMDGGGIAINSAGQIQTVWRREGKIYTAIPGKPEEQIGEGRSCAIETINNRNVYAWSNNGDIVVTNSKGKKIIPGKGNLPVLKALNDGQVICLWEDDKKIHASVFEQ